MQAIADHLAKRTHPETAAGWDPVGLHLGDPSASAHTVAVCHEITEAVVTRLESSPVDVLVTYHPLLFTPVNRVLAGRSPEARAYRLIRLGTSVVVLHTDFDAAPGGTADALAAAFNLRDIEPFGEDTEEGLPAIGRVGAFNESLAALDARATDLFGSSGLRISGPRDQHLSRVAVVPGSGARLVDAAAMVADAIVTGDVPHHQVVRALDLGLSVVDPGHIATERPGMVNLMALVAAIPDVEVLDLTDIDPETWG